MPERPLIIHGAGGHGLVVAEAAEAAGFTLAGFIDDAMTGGFLGEIPIIDPGLMDSAGASIIVAIGDAQTRRRILESHVSAGRETVSIVHPSAVVSPSAKLGKAVFVGPNAVVNVEAQLGDGVIVNSRAIVEHHCVVGAFAHIAPGSALGGGVRVGESTLVGIGASVLPGVSIGSGCTVGAGSVVREDVADGLTVVGSPARAVASSK
jgi:UDP-N-acetylbacillosamine N-acetyltransferase